MKKLILFAAIFAATNLQAQKVDTVKNAVQVKPVVIDALAKDTIYQFSVENIWLKLRDTTGATTHVFYHDRTGRKFKDRNVHIPYSVVKVWLDDSVIEDYILTFLGLTKRK